MNLNPAIRILDPGPLTTIQDLGRPGLAHLGVGSSGGCDRRSLRLANRIIGNDEGAAVLEMTIGGLAAHFTHPTWFAVTGARASVTVNDRQHSFFAPVHAPAGANVRIGMSHEGMRNYLAVRGGLAAERILGSRSTDVLTGIGPSIVRNGDSISIGSEIAGPVGSIDLVPTPAIDQNPAIAVVAGPRSDWFPPEALQTLIASRWTVSQDSNRIGIRLIGPRIGRLEKGELPSEGLIAGAIQVPPSGQPVLFLADHPVTGGYPVLATLVEDAHTLAAQVRIGQAIRFKLLP